ncbi:MAG: hypothetical protein VYE81_02630, partial [Planctomycetota bacterium]|nr:hypothetical protein [Planctomycetota bacterium]
MRRFLLFVLVLGGGLLILFAVARQRDRRRAEDVQVDETTLPPPGDERTVLRLDPPGDQPQVTAGAQIHGYLEYTGHDIHLPGRPRSFQLKIADVVPLAERGLHALRGLEAELFEAETGLLRATVRSPRGRARVSLEGNEPRVGREEPISLEDVDLALLAGTPLAPLTLRSPSLDMDLGQGRFTSDAAVAIEGEGLSASGTGLDARPAEGLVRLERAGTIEVQTGAGSVWRLSATGDGPLDLHRMQAEEGREAIVSVRGGALLEFEGAEGLQLSADEITIEGIEREGPAGRRFFARSADAQGEVRITRGVDEFRGETGRFSFDPEGEFSAATLEGAPQAAFWLEVDAEQPSRRVDLEGQGLLTVRFEPEVAFALGGPAR